MRKLVWLLLLCNKSFAQLEPDAGTWKTWIISSGKEFRLPVPPDKKVTDAEIKELLALQGKRDAESIRQILYWNAGAPGYRWEQFITSVSSNMPSFRAMALLHTAIYDATVAAWDTKYAYNRQRPPAYSSQIKPYIPVPQSPSYPCEHSVAAGAAAAVLSYLFPDKADSILNLARAASQSRLLAGVQYPSDVQSGFELGRKIGEKMVTKARMDRSDAVWKGAVPNQPGLWNGTNPMGATVGTWKPWVLDSSSQFRPPPPPDFTKDMEELKNFKHTFQSKARAFFYATHDFWSEETHQKLFEYNLHTNAPRAARVYALKSITAYDAFIACWDAKYTYWGIRPYQYDTTYKQVLGMPPFPGYPSGHATTSSAVATMMSYLFPLDSKYFEEKARECAESRFEGGIHFRTDNEVGLEMGRKIGNTVIKRASADRADVQKRIVKN